MMGLVFPSGLMTSTGYVGPDKEFDWLLSAFAGIVMCKIGVVSLLFFKGYAKLNDAEKLEWNNRGFSTFHALVVAVASVYLLLFSDLFDENYDNKLIVHRSSTLSDTILGKISIGYFLSDLAMILWNYPALGGMVLHHGLSMFSIFLSLVHGQGQFYILMVLFTESTTPFVNLRWYLDVAGQKNSKLYVCNGVALFFGWLVARILLFIFCFYHLLTHFDQGQANDALGFLHLACSASGVGSDEFVLVLENCQSVVDLVRKAVPLALTSEDDPSREELRQLQEKKEEIDIVAHKQVRRILWSGLGLAVAQVGLFFRLTFWEFSWDVVEPIAFFATATGIVIGYAYFLFTSRDPTYEDLLKRLFLSRRRKLIKKHDFDAERFMELQRKCKCPLDSPGFVNQRIGALVFLPSQGIRILELFVGFDIDSPVESQSMVALIAVLRGLAMDVDDGEAWEQITVEKTSDSWALRAMASARAAFNSDCKWSNWFCRDDTKPTQPYTGSLSLAFAS
ncbi:unnamed protein product [Camellia sinensis]